MTEDSVPHVQHVLQVSGVVLFFFGNITILLANLKKV